MSDPAELYDAILHGNAKKAEEVTKAALAAKVNPGELVQKYMIPAMDEVGKRFECNEYFVPELLIAARAMKSSLTLITPLLADAGASRTGRVVIGTVQGDLHDIGKNLVASMLEGGGFEVIDLGVDVPPQKFVEAAQEKDGSIVALSALLTTTMTMMKTVIDALEKAGVREKTKVMIGGAPITQQYADEIGADGYSDNASAAVALARKLVKSYKLVKNWTGADCRAGGWPAALGSVRRDHWRSLPNSDTQFATALQERRADEHCSVAAIAHAPPTFGNRGEWGLSDRDCF